MQNKNKEPRNKYGQKHGQWIVYYSPGHISKANELFYTENFINDKKVGYEYINWVNGTEKYYYAR